tara:strand:+ start:3006 stop:3518 length:513 start_codon:yes stop_codon:yes gene_type:complete
MWTANFFYKFFKYKKDKSGKIVKFNSYKIFELEDELKNKIQNIDKQITVNSQELLQAQIVKFRSAFSKSNNFLEIIGQNVYKNKLDDSIRWHQEQLKGLYMDRKILKIKLEKIQGIFWISRIKRLLTLISIGFLILFILFIFLSGFMIIIYLLPIILFIYLGYWIASKKH